MGGELGVGGQGHFGGPEPEVQPRVLRRRGNHRQALDAHALEPVLEGAELRQLPPAEGAPQAEHQRKEERAAAAVVVERDDAGAGDRREGKVRRQFAGRHGMHRRGHVKDSFPRAGSAKERKHDERVGIEPGAIADVPGERHIALGLHTIIGIEVQGCKPFVARKE